MYGLSPKVFSSYDQHIVEKNNLIYSVVYLKRHVYTHKYLWEITLKSLLQLDGLTRIPKLSCDTREIPIESSQKVQISQNVLQN